ncbi:MAG: UDP-N-acetylmuramate dehydrogenase [Deltaproteobacteria bacterium]|nr:MAG: UDP-N-acetylmuramate dehydrogenase [Deltaproteobacteria bacterium]
MNDGVLEERIRKEGFKGEARRQAPMREITSFKIGGPADLILFPQDLEDLQVLITLFRREGIEYLVLGNGTNLLVSDKGVRDPLISLSEGFKEIKTEGTKIRAEGGVGLPQLLHFCAENALGGMEPLAGIPGTVGGGIRMNAGSWGVEMEDLLSSVTVMGHLGQIRWLEKEKLVFSYRGIDLPAEEIILQGEFTLQKGEREEIKARMEDFLRRRRETQPFALPSAGSIFKNPQGISAGKLIEGVGLKGFRLGDAMISPLHANFIVNLGTARAKDVLRLMDLIEERVYQERGVKLEREVVIIGEPNVAE